MARNISTTSSLFLPPYGDTIQYSSFHHPVKMIVSALCDWSTLFFSSTEGWGTWILTAVAGYIILCTTFRNSQKRAVEAAFDFNGQSSLANMTLKDAYAIQTWLAEQQFPSTFSAALFFALFKV